MNLVCGGPYLLNNGNDPLKMYTRGTSDGGAGNSISTTSPPSHGGDSANSIYCYGGTINAMEIGPSWAVDSSTTNYTIFGGYFRVDSAGYWPPKAAIGDIRIFRLFELSGSAQCEIKIRDEGTDEGDLFLQDSTGAEILTISDPFSTDTWYLIVCAVQLGNTSGTAKSYLWLYDSSGTEVDSDSDTSGTADFNYSSPADLELFIAGQSFGVQIGSPSHVFHGNTFVYEKSTDPVNDHLKKQAFLEFVCSKNSAQADYLYDGSSKTLTQSLTTGTWDDTDHSSSTPTVEHETPAGSGLPILGGMVYMGTLEDHADIDSGTEFHGAGCTYQFNNGRYYGNGTMTLGYGLVSETDISSTVVSTTASDFNRNNDHGVTLLQNTGWDYLDDFIAGFWVSQEISKPAVTEMIKMRAWAYVDPDTFTAPAVSGYRLPFMNGGMQNGGGIG